MELALEIYNNLMILSSPINPETSINKEIGFNWSNNPINFEMSLYDTNIENMITYSILHIQFHIDILHQMGAEENI